MSDPTPTDEQIRALLAEARLDEPMPADVAARLDGVLADLGADRAPAAVPLPDRSAARRRRRRSLVLAAAAVVAIGVGSTQVDLSGAGSGADSGAATQDSAADGAAESQAESQATGPDADGAGAATLAVEHVVLHPGTFARDVRRALGPAPLSATTLDRLTKDELAARSGRGAWIAPYAADCAVRDAGRGRRIPAEYDGRPAILVLRPAEDGARRVDLYPCGSAAPLRSTTIAAP